ncbi:MAG: alpha/beta hydrolase [Pseudomonadota bacterium]|nr:alpha/beta hydrolase [Pseudomonadota bacterium]
MSRIRTRDGLTLAYESMGPVDAPTVILIMGLGAQMHVWPTSLCQQLVLAGYRVIRFDNRDTGASSSLDHAGNPSLIRAWLAGRLNRGSPIPYTLKDMSRDVLALMDALELPSAHLIGASMGGMIAQRLAAKKRRRVRSLTSIMSSASLPRLPVRQWQVLLQLAKRPARDDRHAHRHYLNRLNAVMGSPAYPMTEEEIHQLAERNWQRQASPHGVKRQLAAITHAGDRRRLLRKIKVRTLVIHGADDPLIPVTQGIETASLIPDARMRVVLGMGHDFPEALVPKLSKMLIKHLNKSEKRWMKRHKRRTSNTERQQSSPTSPDMPVIHDPMAWLDPPDSAESPGSSDNHANNRQAEAKAGTGTK